MMMVGDLAAAALEAGLRWTVLFAAALLILHRSTLSAAARHHSWMVLLAGLLLLPLAGTVLPSYGVARPILPGPWDDAGRVVQSEAAASAGPGRLLTGEEPGARPRTPPTGGPQSPSAPRARLVPESAAPATDPTGGSGGMMSVMRGMWPWMWLGGTLGLLGYWVIGQLGLRWLRRSSVCAPAPQVAILGACARRLCIRRKVHLGHSRQNLIPLTWGWFRPVVILPACSTSWSTERLRRVLLHELAHVARFDSPLQSLVRITCSVFWFHPGVWYVARRARREAELACDDRVLEMEGTPFDYVEDLLRIAWASRTTPLAGAALPMAGRSGLDERVRALLSSGRRRGPSRRHAGFTAIGAVVLISGVATIRWTDPSERAEALHEDGLRPAALEDGRTVWTMDCGSTAAPVCTDGTRRAVALLERTGRTGAVIAQSVSSGEVVVYASVRSPGSDRSAALPRVEPGSVAKLALAALWWESGWADSLTACPAEAQLPSGTPLRNAGGYSSGRLTAERMLVVSCNTAAVAMAERLIERHGAGGYARALDQMGLGGHTLSRPQIGGSEAVPRGSDTGPDDVLLLAGLGMNGSTTTPLHISRFLQAVGNGGLQVPPRNGPGGDVAAQPRWLMGYDAAARLQRAMLEVVHQGTGTRALPQLEWSRWTLAGKTGTVPRGADGADGWFAGLAHGPDGRAEYTIVVLVEGGGIGGGSPAGVAAEMTRLFARVRGDEL